MVLARQNHQDSLLSQNPYGRPLSLEVGTQLTMGKKMHIYIYGHPPMICLDAFYIGITMFAYKA